jgi:hypothetical protein
MHQSHGVGPLVTLQQRLELLQLSAELLQGFCPVVRVVLQPVLAQLSAVEALQEGQVGVLLAAVWQVPNEAVLQLHLCQPGP